MDFRDVSGRYGSPILVANTNMGMTIMFLANNRLDEEGTVGCHPLVGSMWLEVGRKCVSES